MITPLAWVFSQGQVVPQAQVTIPAHAPAVLFGESIFETFLVDQGRIFRLDAHLERMAAALRDVDWNETPKAQAVREGLRALVAASHGSERLRARLTLLNLGDRVEGILSVSPYTPPAAHGVGLCVTDVLLDPHSPTARHKTGNRWAQRMAQAQAQRAGAFDGLLCTPDGWIADGATSTPFWVSEGKLRTPALSCGALPGITRRSLLELAREGGLAVEEGRFNPDAVRAAEEVFCSNALIGVLPVEAIDGEAVGHSVPGPVTAKLAQAYRRWVDEAATEP